MLIARLRKLCELSQICPVPEDASAPRTSPLMPPTLCPCYPRPRFQVLVARLRELCLQEREGLPPISSNRFSSLSQEAREWSLDKSKPCSGERMLLMFDRWNKLLKNFYRCARAYV